MALEPTVRRAKRRVHAALLVNGINEVDGLHGISLRVFVGKFFMRTSRECPAKETAFASATRKARCWCLARTYTSTVSLFLRIGPSPDHCSDDIVSWYMNGIASGGYSFPAAAVEESSPATAKSRGKRLAGVVREEACQGSV